MFSKPSFRITIVVLVLGAAFVTLAFLNRESGKRSASAPAAAVSSGLTFHGRGGGGAVPQSSSRLVRPQVSAQALQDRYEIAQHAEALAGAPIQSAYYGAVPQSSSRFDAAQAARERDIVVNHSEALQGAAVIRGDWHTHEFNAAHSSQARSVVENHGDVLDQMPGSAAAGEWYGAIPSTSPDFNAAEALRLRALIERHGEVLQSIVP